MLTKTGSVQMDIELVTEGLFFPEGPMAMADGSVILVEIGGKRLTRVRPDGFKETVAELGGGPNGAAIGPDGAAYVVNNGGAFRFPDDWESVGRILIPDSYDGGYVQRVDLNTGEVRGLYYARADGSSIKRVRSEQISPNGVGLSPDGKTVYWSDSMLQKLWALDLD